MSDFHVKLERTDGILEFNLCDSGGKVGVARKNIGRDQTPTMAVRIDTGDDSRGAQDPPFAAANQETMDTGFGSDVFEDDPAQFYQSRNLQTWFENKAMLGSQAQYANGVRPYSIEHWFEDNTDADESYSREEMGINDGNWYYYSYKVTPDENFTPKYIYLAHGNDQSNNLIYIKVAIYSDNGSGKPDASLMVTAESTPSVYEGEYRYEIVSPVQMNSGVDYHVVVGQKISPISPMPSGYHFLCSDTVAGNTAYQWDGDSWETFDKGIFFRLVADDTPFDIFPFEHLGAQYFILSYRDGTAPRVFMNGVRGIVESATADTFTVDGTPFTADELIDWIVKFYDGVGAYEDRSWRLVSDNTTSVITGDSNWDRQPTVGTKFVCVRGNDFTEVTGHGMTGRVTDVQVINDIVYILFGDHDDLWHMYDDEFTQEVGNKGSFMKLAFSVDDEMEMVWVSRRKYLQIACCEPVYPVDADTVVIEDLSLDFGESPIGDPDMELDDGSWTGGSQSTGQVFSGTYSRVVSGAAGTAMEQTGIAIPAGTEGVLSAQIWGVDTEVKVYVDGDLVWRTGAGHTGYWILWEMNHVAGATTEIKFEVYDGAGTFYVDAVGFSGYNAEVSAVSGERVTGLDIHGDPKRLVILTNGGVKTQDEDGKWIDVSPGEMAGNRDYRNGSAAIARGSDLVFVYRESLLKYYDGDADNIGSNLVDGLLEERRGDIADLALYGDWLLAAIDAGVEGVSSILLYNDQGWHEVHRAPAAGLRITGLCIQTIPGRYVDRLWFNQGADIVWKAIDANPLECSDFPFVHSGYVDMAKICGSMREIEKFFQSTQVMADNLSDDCWITAGPRGDEGWDLVQDYPEPLSAPWGDFNETADKCAIEDLGLTESYTLTSLAVHLSFYNSKPSDTPELESFVVRYLEHHPTADKISMRLMAADARRSLTGESSYDLISDDYETLESWRDSGRPVRLTVNASPVMVSERLVKIVYLGKFEVLSYNRRTGAGKVAFTLAVVDAV